MALDPSAVRHGRVRGRYFRENFAQAGIDLVQIVPKLVTNADAAIAAAGRRHGRIELSFGEPEHAFLEPEVFEGRVRVEEERGSPRLAGQATLELAG